MQIWAAYASCDLGFVPNSLREMPLGRKGSREADGSTDDGSRRRGDRCCSRACSWQSRRRGTVSHRRRSDRFPGDVAFSGLTNPTVVRFASDGRVFVAEKSGLIKVFDNLSDPTPTVFADLRTNVHNFWDRGLLGMALDPELPAEPVRLRPLHVRPRARLPEPRAPRWRRLVPDPTRTDVRRLRRQRTAVAPAGGRAT